ncbi:MAG: preprotein translocase subunit SecG [Gammaproteobacteria bacterium]|nr:preprotein translocase subunit SecG [Gammaproteobacteria bacterium]
MYQLLLTIHILIAVTVIGLVLLQHGKGADIGAAFGSGASNTVFGSQGTGNFLFKLTGGLVLAFFTTSVLLSATVARQHQSSLALPSTESTTTSSIPIPSQPGS